MKTTECSNCGAKAAIVQGTYEFKQLGLPVRLHGIEIVKCPRCGNEDPIIPRVNKLMRSIAMALIRKPYGLEGAEVRFLRKYLGMTGEEFAEYLDVDKTNLSKWENDADPIGPQSDRLIRLVCLGKGHLQKALPAVVDSFTAIQERRQVRLEMDAETMQARYAA